MPSATYFRMHSVFDIVQRTCLERRWKVNSKGESKDFQRRDWVMIGLSGMCVLLIACNIALLQRYRWERNGRLKEREERLKLQQAEATYKQLRIQQALQEKGTWEKEIRVLRHALEEALDCWHDREYSQVITSLGEHDYSSLPIAYYIRGLSHVELKQDAKALQDLSDYIDHVCFSNYARLKRAEIYLRHDRVALAIEDLKEALYHRDDFTPARQLLDKLEKNPQSDDAGQGKK